MKKSILFTLICVGSILCIISITNCKNGTTASSFKLITIDSMPPHNPWAKIVADLDNDSYTDFIIGGQNGPLVWYKSPTWEKYLIAEGGYNTVDGEAGDINNDGYPDLVLGGLFWYENPGVLDNNPEQIWKVHKITDHPTHDVELADVNKDGMLDIVTRDQSEFGHTEGNTIHIWYQTNDTIWTEDIISCPHGEGIKCIDLDNDNDTDIIIGGEWFENQGGDGKVTWGIHVFTEWHSNATVDVADINNDGRKDIVLVPSELAGEYYKISWFEAPETIPDGEWTEHLIADSVECVVHSLKTADFTNDGLPDILYAEMHQGHDPDEVVLMVNNNNGGNWEKQVLSSTGSHMLQVTDFNNDGYLDFFGANWGGDFPHIQLWENMLMGF